MTLEELIAKRKELMAQVNDADAELFAKIKDEVAKIDYQIEETEKQEENERKAKQIEAEKRAAQIEAEKRAARLPANGVLFDQGSALNAEKRKKEIEATEKRGKDLREGKTVKLEKRAVLSSNAAISTIASDEINPAFEQVGTLDKLVHVTPLHGAESYKKPFVKTYAEGGVTEEGKGATTAEPTMGYATINKIKVTAYAEITEETEKLPDAEYVKVVDDAAYGAYRKKLIQQIISGSGSGEMIGIINAPTTTIEETQTKVIASVDENTLDNIIFDYGGDEDVEGDAYLIINKLTLKAFATVKGTDKKRAYDIVIKGNTGTINGIPFVCTSKLAPFATVTAGNPYIIYGKLSGYELTEFAPVEMAKSTDYKFKEGMTAIKVSGLVGGAPAMWNGFMKVVKASE